MYLLHAVPSAKGGPSAGGERNSRRVVSESGNGEGGGRERGTKVEEEERNSNRGMQTARISRI